MAEFGGSLVNENIEDEVSNKEVEHDMPLGRTENGIELREYQSGPQGAEIIYEGPMPSVSIFRIRLRLAYQTNFQRE